MRPVPTAAIAATLLVLTACGSDGTGTATQSIAVTAGDTSCDISPADVAAGEVELIVTNTGQQTTEVYVYGEGDRVVGEVENVTPGLTRSFTVTVGGGDYQVACKPGQTGDGIRTPLEVSGEAITVPEATTSIDFTSVDHGFVGLGEASFGAGDVVAFRMQNTGSVEHEFELFGPDGEELGEIGPTAAGEHGEVVLPLAEAGTYRYVCGIDDHEARGMVGEFVVS